ncbi:MAG: NADH-quinone oxidoreductase subunit M [Acidobacteria bacterium]|nr:NADH-quinone oxidoreductase subunit M [Acidobacteriota bacterium]
MFETLRQHWLSLVVFAPLASAAVLLFLPPEGHERLRRVAVGASLAVFVLSLPLPFWFDLAQGGMQFRTLAPWITLPGFTTSYHVGVDGLSVFLVLLTTFLTPLAVLSSWPITQRVKWFFIALFVLETGMLGVFVALDLFLFFVFWEVMLVPMYFIIGLWGHERRVYAAVKFIIYTMAGSALMLVAILWLRHLAGSFDLLEIMGLLRSGLLRFGSGQEQLLFLAFFLAFAIKVPLFPFHTWLPDAHVEAPTAGSVILAGVLLKMGAYGLLRFCLPLFPHATREFSPWIVALALISIIYGALVSLVQPDAKKLVAYSSVSHMGFVVLGILALNEIGIEGAILQMVNHGVSTGGLFLIVGMLYDRRHTHVIREFGGLGTPLPVLSSFFLLVILSSLGLPMLNNFVGEFLILVGVFESSPWQAAVAAVGIVLAAWYLLWMYQRLVFGQVRNEKNRALPDANRRELAILVSVAVMILWLGLASPMFTRRMEATTRLILDHAQTSPVEWAVQPPAPEEAR